MVRPELKYSTDEIRCKNCSSPLRVRGMGRTNAMGCEYCGAIHSFNAESVAIISQARKFKSKIDIPIGSRGVFDDIQFEVIGYQRRCEQTHTYYWSEYLLFNPYHGFRWLAEQNGHWIFVTADPSIPVDPKHNNFSLKNPPSIIYPEGQRFLLFGDCEAQVVEVVGECYWEVRAGDKVRMLDYINPPYGYSVEIDQGEINYSHSKYINRKELQEAFKANSAKLNLPKTIGLSPTIPNPFKEGKVSMLMSCLTVIAIITLIQLFFVVISSSRMIFDQELSNVAINSSSDPRSVLSNNPRNNTGQPRSSRTGPKILSSQSFQLGKRKANIRVDAKAPVSNSWISLTIALIRKDGAVFDEKELEIAYYFGRDSEGSWSEGSTSASLFFDEVPQGEYYFTVSAETDKAPAVPYRLKLIYDAPYWGHYSLALVLLFLYPAYILIRYFKFETRRAELSDFS